MREKQEIPRPSRWHGGFSPRLSGNREYPEEEWIQIGGPAIAGEKTVGLCQEWLVHNKRISARCTIDPTLLRKMLVCGECRYTICISSMFCEFAITKKKGA